ncbi:acyl carrier protein [uncultured Roseobacter sp.]|uniref:acyl carrier protein n=1 Tax=uncultured Roseobacter sp. TaxID=114847 RepID=UPI00260CA339|nr:acyl carrier protein [uncultured Roseobacter sp.]
MSYPTLRTFIADEFAMDLTPDQLTDDLDLIENGIIDSLGVLKLIAFLEGEFDLIITPDELDPDNYHTISMIEDIIREKHKTAA